MATKKAKSTTMGGSLSEFKDFSGDLSALEAGQYGFNADTRLWYFRTPNGVLAELPDSRVVKEDDGTLSVPLAISAEMVDEEDPKERIYWTGTIDHGKWVPNE